ncbi:hypothetical protein EV363DRAFT_1444196 [Boletus edulis]|nr:hypothetical protein EV363DRAFT_1444196 [Boletus edulis]
MPLDPIPPPSSCGKVPPPKHIWSTISCLPKGHLQSPLYSSCISSTRPSSPCCTWSWVTKTGPNKGKPHTIPSFPISGGKEAPKAIRWLTSLFHSFKTHLHALALEPDSGRVLQPIVQLYQNNMLVHLHGQHTPPTNTPPPPSLRAVKPHPLPPVTHFMALASWQLSIPPLSPCTAPTVLPPRSTSPHPRSPTSSTATKQERTAHPDHQWLQAASANLHLFWVI